MGGRAGDQASERRAERRCGGERDANGVLKTKGEGEGGPGAGGRAAQPLQAGRGGVAVWGTGDGEEVRGRRRVQERNGRGRVESDTKQGGEGGRQGPRPAI